MLRNKLTLDEMIKYAEECSRELPSWIRAITEKRKKAILNATKE